MKTKLICILSVLLLCGCNSPSINEKYTVISCVLDGDGTYSIEISKNFIGIRGSPVKEVYRLNSNTPLNVGKDHIIRMEEVK
jgi:hypothetical protein